MPRQVREHLAIDTGDRIDFVIDDAGEVRVRAAAIHVRQLRGILARPGARAVSTEEMNKVIASRARREK